MLWVDTGKSGSSDVVSKNLYCKNPLCRKSDFQQVLLEIQTPRSVSGLGREDKIDVCTCHQDFPPPPPILSQPDPCPKSLPSTMMEKVPSSMESISPLQRGLVSAPAKELCRNEQSHYRNIRLPLWNLPARSCGSNSGATGVMLWQAAQDGTACHLTGVAQKLNPKKIRDLFIFMTNI